MKQGRALSLTTALIAHLPLPPPAGALSKPSEQQLRKGALFWRTPRSCLARASLPISLASRVSAAAPLFWRPLVGPLVSRRHRTARAAALVARASRALVSLGCRTLRAAVFVARASHIDPALASRGRNAAALVAAPLLLAICIRAARRLLVKQRNDAAL